MNFSCTQAMGSYERIPSDSSLELQSLNESDSSPPRETELPFYNDNGNYKSVVVEENLRAADLCQLLAMKNHVAKDVNWSITEHLANLNLERSLEDHEEILQIHTSWGKSNKSHGNRFYFRKDYRKYEFFHQPQQFFPAEMVAINEEDIECISESPETSRLVTLKNVLVNSDKTPGCSDHMWVRELGKQVWKKAYFVLHEKSLYYSYKVVSKDISQLRKLADLSSHNIYVIQEGKKNYKAPSDFCFCLKPNSSDSSEGVCKELHLFSCETDRARFCWITTMRIAKYGRVLRENYNSFKTRHLEAGTPGSHSYQSHQLPLESVRTRVAMDFTGSTGRIVHDPIEAKAIAEAEGRLWSKKRRPGGRAISGGALQGCSLIHITQPWFYSGLTREEATQLLGQYGTVDGVFLVRESRSTKDEYVLSYTHSGRSIHTRIIPVEERQKTCYSIDNGRTKFYDLLQLVEFYQLNKSCLPTRLTHVLGPPASGMVSISAEDARRGSN